MNIVVFQLHVRGWIESIECTLVRVPSVLWYLRSLLKKSNLERMRNDDDDEDEDETALNASGISPP